MLFNLEYDDGSLIVGWAVADGVSTSLDLRVCAGGEDILILRADEDKPGIVAYGRHETGACGFRLSIAQIPNLADLHDLEIYECSSGLLIYRRFRPGFLHKKILRLETSLLPLWRLDNSISLFFQYTLSNIEKYGKETTTEVFQLRNIPSVYLNGRILFSNYSYYIESNFECITVLQDPYEEMAERILILSHMQHGNLSHLGERDIVSLQPAVAYFAKIDISDEAAVHRAFKLLPEEVGALLADPLVRQLTTTVPGERAGRRSVTASLDVLASFAIVSLRSESDRFIDGCAELLGIEPSALPPIPGNGKVPVLAGMLRRSNDAGYLIEKDRELFSYISDAYKKASDIHA